MFKKNVLILSSSLLLLTSVHASENTTAWELFDWMESALKGEWKLSPAEAQIGTESYKHKAILPMIGTDTTAMAFKLIGADVTIQEDLLPNTAKQMVSMYHCKDIACTNLKATHYCTKQNQPEFLANLHDSTKTKIIFECDMSTELCQSDEDHVHQIIHEISDDGKHLKSSYLAWKDKKPKSESSIYYFERK
ncbi:MAG: hypothetical protein PHI47_05470 [Sulfuricurvum sp.]|uniref:hypothetical protein n=1 Tax=Sulfuricurvum sp. TaxID=2025608 RepID=UPI0026145F0B|nr:hypothetical protein [Sulfuricurvum sp.]MDD5159478.1 hypothetical protein [Sulfuricurvum sp.]